MDLLLTIATEMYQVKPVLRNLENMLLTIIQFEYVPLDHHAALLEAISFPRIYSIVKECCEMYPFLITHLNLFLTMYIYVLGLDLFYPSHHGQMETLNVFLNDKYARVVGLERARWH